VGVEMMILRSVLESKLQLAAIIRNWAVEVLKVYLACGAVEVLKAYPACGAVEMLKAYPACGAVEVLKAHPVCGG